MEVEVYKTKYNENYEQTRLEFEDEKAEMIEMFSKEIQSLKMELRQDFPHDLQKENKALKDSVASMRSQTE